MPLLEMFSCLSIKVENEKVLYKSNFALLFDKTHLYNIVEVKKLF